jgi:FAD synthase
MFQGVHRGHPNLSESEDENYKQGENSIPER